MLKARGDGVTIPRPGEKAEGNTASSPLPVTIMEQGFKAPPSTRRQQLIGV
ncbi:MAG: hypothetical protein KME55_34175 [Nostoc indistinguendum CM1-VF10]|nr:hypothetical protein [Nostoc indistinguendum CM1-VF10]